MMTIDEVLSAYESCRNCWNFNEDTKKCEILNTEIYDNIIDSFVCDGWWHKEGRPEDFERYQNDEY